MQGDLQRIGAPVGALDAEGVFLDKIIDRDGALVLLVGTPTPDRGLVECDGDQSVGPVGVLAMHAISRG